MSPSPSPDFGLARPGSTPSPRELSEANVNTINEELCLLTIRTRYGSALERFVTESVLRDWCETAAQKRVSLGVRWSGAALELYSTKRDSTLAFAVALRTVAHWSRLDPELRQFDISFRRGDEVASALLADTARTALRCAEQVDSKPLGAVVQVSDRADTASHAITSLFRAAAEVERRVANETLDGDPDPSEAMVEIADLCAARIVEEELLLWKTGRVERKRSLSRLRLSLPHLQQGSSSRFSAANDDSA